MIDSRSAERLAAAASATRRERAAEVAVVVTPALVAMAVGLVTGMRAEPWRDEYATAMFAALSPGELAAAASHVDAVLAPYYLLMHAVVPAFGIPGARVVSLLALAATAGVAAAIARRWWGGWAGAASGMMIALNPMLVSFGTQARPTVLAVCAVAVAVLFVELAAAGRRGMWWWYAAAAVVAVLLQLFAVIPVALSGVLVVGPSRRHGQRWVAASVPAAVVALVLLAAGWGQRAQVAWIPRPAPTPALLSLADVSGTAVPVSMPAGLVVLGVLLVAAGFVVALRRMLGGRRVVFAVSLLLVPWLLLLVVSWLVSPVFVARYFGADALGAAWIVGALVFVARRCAQTAVRVAAGLLVAVLVVSATWATVSRMRHPPASPDGYGAIAHTLRQQAQPGDLLVVVQNFGEGGLAYGFAENMTDGPFASGLIARLSSGTQPVVEVRRVVSTDPWRTAAVGAGGAAVGSGGTGGGTVWLFAHAWPSRAQLAAIGPVLAACLESQSGVRSPPNTQDVLVRFGGCSAP